MLALTACTAAKAAAQMPRFFPYCANFWELHDECGKVWHLHVADMTGKNLQGEGWKATIGRKGYSQAERAGLKYIFEHGALVKIEVPGREDLVYYPPVRLDANLDSLFPDEEAALKEAQENSDRYDIWKDEARFRGFYGNPNKTAVLFTLLAIILFGGSFCAKLPLWARIPAGLLALATVWAVFSTGSRGGLVSLALGFAVVALGAAIRRISWKVLAGIVAVVFIGAVALFTVPGAKRFTSGSAARDASDSLRVNIMKAFPSMLHDAPGGWGSGMSGASYTMWYRPDNEMHPSRALISTHFTLLAERGWVARFVYIFLWALVLALGVSDIKRNAVTLALWAAFGASMAFNHTGEEWTLWILPLLSLLLLRPSANKTAISAIAALFVSAATCIGLWYAGQPKRGDIQISKDGCKTLVNAGNVDKDPVVIACDTVSLGGWMFYGREMLAFYEDNSEAAPALIVDDVDALPFEADRLVLTGRRCMEYVEKLRKGEKVCKAKAILVLSPSADPRGFYEDLAKIARTRVIMGSLTLPLMDEMTERPQWLRVVRGAQLYIPNWLAVALDF